MGVPVDAVTMEQSVERCLELIKKRGQQHVVVNAAKVVMANDRSDVREAIASCPLINADGQAVVWAARLLGTPLPERVAGIDLMHQLVDAAVEHDLGIYLLGAQPHVVSEVADSFASRGARIVGYRDGFWEADQEHAVVQQVAAAAPDILFVAIPSPRKELLLSTWLDELNVGIAFGVGGSFDIVAGITKRAPRAMQRLGLEWLYRLSQEPRRMFKRYLVGNTRFILLMIKHRLRHS